jgi:hypothetical protein
MRLYLSIALLALVGCEREQEVDDKVIIFENTFDNLDDASVIKESDQSIYGMEGVWVCNHPKTNQHNKVCVEEQYPRGCYIEGDDGKFCWLLTKDECLSSSAKQAGWSNLCALINYD